MSIGLDYDPRYVTLDDIPISGPDRYGDDEKRKALFHAEARLEAEINDGERIPATKLSNLHKLAAMNLATHVLTHSAKEPSDVRLGDLADDGSTIPEYSSKFKDEYDELVQAIQGSEEDVGGVDNYTYTSS